MQAQLWHVALLPPSDALPFSVHSARSMSNATSGASMPASPVRAQLLPVYPCSRQKMTSRDSG